MQILVCSQPGLLEYKTADMPVAGEGETLLRIERIGICGTDLHAFEGTQPYFTYPRILGHEVAATIVETKAEGFANGDAVTFIPYLNCGKCVACRRGLSNCCAAIKVCGVHIDGAMQQFYVVPNTALIKRDGLSLDELALCEPLAIGAHGIRRAGVEAGEYVLVIGAGPIGIGTMEFARIAGAHVIAMDVNDDRLQFCATQLGIEHVVNPAKQNAVEAIREITNGDFATVVIDATGSLRAINGSLQYLAHGGRLVLIGLQKESFAFSHPEFHKRETTLMSSRNATRADFEHVLNCLAEKKVNPSVYITHRVGFDEVAGTFESWLNPANKVIKAMVSM